MPTLRSSTLFLLVLAGLSCGSPSPGPDAGSSTTAADAGGSTTAPDSGSIATTPDAGRALSPAQDGVATFAALDGSGACSFPASPDDLRVAAMSGAQWEGSAVCGMCLRVEGPRGQVVVRVVDLCPECVAGQVDLSREAFSEIADPVDARVTIRWQPVACDVQGPIVLRFKEGSSAVWTALQVRNALVPVRTLEVQRAAGWVEVPRLDSNYFVEPSGLGDGPYTLRLTGRDGQQLVEPGVVLRDGQEVTGTQQFN